MAEMSPEPHFFMLLGSTDKQAMPRGNRGFDPAKHRSVRPRGQAASKDLSTHAGAAPRDSRGRESEYRISSRSWLPLVSWIASVLVCVEGMLDS